jgi:AAA+ superfamily predicted ATPase
MNDVTRAGIDAWAAANRDFLLAELDHLRLLLRRHALWLRQQWRAEPPAPVAGLAISDSQADRLFARPQRQAEHVAPASDPESGTLAHQIAAARSKVELARQAAVEHGGPPALDLLERLLGLAAFDRALVLLCLGTELEPGLARLYAYLQDDATRRYPTLELACALFCDGPGESLAARNSLLPEAPLRRCRILRLAPGAAEDAPHAARALVLDERVVAYLLGSNQPDERLADHLAPLPPAPLTPDHQVLLQRLLRWADAQGRALVDQRLNLVGPAASGKRALAHALCSGLGLDVRRLDLRALPLADAPEFARLLEREAMLLQCGLYIDTSELERERAAERGLLDLLLARCQAFCLIGGTMPWIGTAPALSVALRKPDAAAKLHLWDQALVGVPHRLNGALRNAAQQFDFGPSEVAETIALARRGLELGALEGAAAALADEDLWNACRTRAQRDLSDMAQRIEPCCTWDDIVLPAAVKAQLREIADQVAFRPRVYEDWGFGAKLSRGRGISALFSGASGTGKTMAAEVLAHHLQLDLYRVDLSSTVSKYIGETEKNLRRIFDAAEACGAILFFDEADALFGKRSEIKDSHDRYANIEVDYLLMRMEDYRGLGILSTNMKAQLDAGFLRRLRFIVEFPLPDAASRLRIWRKAFPAQAQTEALDYGRLGRMEISGANIRSIALNAAFLAAAAGRVIGMDDILTAARREYQKIEKLPGQAELEAVPPREGRT